MRVAIVGGGGAGLAAAWLLDAEHDVTLLERDDRLGGHASTLDVVVNPEDPAVSVDLGPEFLSRPLFPMTLRLIEQAGVRLREFPLTVALTDARRRGTLLLPPIRRDRVSWPALRMLPHLWRLQRLLLRPPTDVGLERSTFTIEQLLDGAHASDAFRRDLFYPIALAGWCVDLEDFKSYAAYNVLRYMAPEKRSALAPAAWLDLEGGMRAYIQAVAAQLRHVRVELNAEVSRIQPIGQGYRLSLASGQQLECDVLILATNASQAAALLSDVPEAEELCGALGSVEYFSTKIAVHGDPRVMPPQRRDWSVVNVRSDGVHSQSTMWKSWLQPQRGNVFKSWVTYDDALPEPLYALREFAHAKINRTYFEAQSRLHSLQGRSNIWLAGVYTHDIDSHESAIRSAANIAEQLAPGASRLRMLTVPTRVDVG